MTHGRTVDARPRCTWDYAPAPESRDAASLKPSLRPVHRRRSSSRRRTARGRRRSTRPPRSRWPRWRSPGRGDVARAVAAARAAAPKWAALPPLERGKYLFRIARLIQERARELAVVESLDGGKPIRESRDVDVPLAAAHFFSYAGWADKLAYALGGRACAPRGVVGQVVPWNFPLLMAAWKLAPALACGNTAVLKPAETTPLTALLLAEICQEAELPAGRREHRHRRRRARARRWCARSVDKVAFTGSTAVGKEIQRALAGTGTRAHAGARRQVGQHRLRGRRARPGGRGHHRGHLLQPGPRLLRGLAAAAAGERRRGGHAQAVGADGAPARRRPAGQEHRRRRDQLAPRSSSGSRRSWPRASARARRGARSPARCPRPATGSRRRCSSTSRRPTGSRSRRSSARSSRSPRSARPPEAVERANNSAYGLAAGVWTDNGAKAFEVAGALRAGVVWQNTYNSSTRRPRSAATRRAASAARAARPACCRTWRLA